MKTTGKTVGLLDTHFFVGWLCLAKQHRNHGTNHLLVNSGGASERKTLADVKWISVWNDCQQAAQAIPCQNQEHPQEQIIRFWGFRNVGCFCCFSDARVSSARGRRYKYFSKRIITAAHSRGICTHGSAIETGKRTPRSNSQAVLLR